VARRSDGRRDLDRRPRRAVIEEQQETIEQLEKFIVG